MKYWIGKVKSRTDIDSMVSWTWHMVSWYFFLGKLHKSPLRFGLIPTRSKMFQNWPLWSVKTILSLKVT